MDYVIPAQNVLPIPPFIQSMTEVLTAKTLGDLAPFTWTLGSSSTSWASMKAVQHAASSAHCRSLPSAWLPSSPASNPCSSSPFPPCGCSFSIRLQLALPRHSLTPSPTLLTSVNLRIFSYTLTLTVNITGQLCPSRTSSGRTAMLAASAMAISPGLQT